MALFSTSRKPSQATRSLARQMSRIFPGSAYMTRGKKSIGSIAESAANMGEKRVAMLMERHGNPERVAFVGVGDSGWDWLPEEMRILSYEILEKKPLKTVRIGDRKISSLFLCGDAESENEMAIDNGKMRVLSEGREIFRMAFKLTEV